VIDVFVSYSRTDAATVRPFVDSLRAEHKLSVWMDEKEIDPFSHIGGAIASGIENARAVVIWHTPDYSLRPYCLWEFCQVLIAVRRGQASMAQLIPVNGLGDEGPQALGLAGSILFARNQGPRRLSALVAERLQQIHQPIGSIPPSERVDLSDFARFGIVRLSLLCQIDERLWGRIMAAGQDRPSHAIIAGPLGSGRRTLAEQYSAIFASLYPGGHIAIDAASLGPRDVMVEFEGMSGERQLVTALNVNGDHVDQVVTAWSNARIPGSLVVTTDDIAHADVLVPPLAPAEAVQLLKSHWPEVSERPAEAAKIVEKVEFHAASIVAAALELRLGGMPDDRTAPLFNRQSWLDDLSEATAGLITDLASLSLTTCPIAVLRAGFRHDERAMKRSVREIEYTHSGRVVRGCLLLQPWVVSEARSRVRQGPTLDLDAVVVALCEAIEKWAGSFDLRAFFGKSVMEKESAESLLLRSARALADPEGAAPLRHRVTAAGCLARLFLNVSRLDECRRYAEFAREASAQAGLPNELPTLVLASAEFLSGHHRAARGILDSVSFETSTTNGEHAKRLSRQINAELGGS
jgi:hypothetical protein